MASGYLLVLAVVIGCYFGVTHVGGQFLLSAFTVLCRQGSRRSSPPPRGSPKAAAHGPAVAGGGRETGALRTLPLYMPIRAPVANPGQGRRRQLP